MSSLRRSASSSSIPVLKRDGSSMIPVMRREGSSLSLSRRDSRPTVRQSRISEARAKQTHQKRNSKSMDRFSSKLTTPLVSNRARNSNQTPLTSGNKKRTPSYSKSPLSSGVSVKKVDKRPINDKEWQKQQLIKVQNFLFTKFQVTEKLKAGISIEMFVGITHQLFKFIDERINITKENYVEEVPARLKCYRYPAAVKPSLMKTVNVPHSWSHIIAILSWLVDLIEKLESMKQNLYIVPTTDNCTDADLFLAKARAHFDVVVRRQNKEGETSVSSEYEQNLCDVYQVNPENSEKCESEIELLNKQNRNLAGKEEDILRINREYRDKIEIIEKNIENSNFNKAKMLEDLRVLREEIAEKEDTLKKKEDQLFESIGQLKEVISNQEYNIRTRKEFSLKLADLKFTETLKEQRLKELKEKSDSNDLKLAENRRTVQTVVNKINCFIIDAKRIKPDFCLVTLRDTKFTDPEFLNEMNLFEVQYEKEKSDSVKRLQETEETYQTLIDVKNEVTNKCYHLDKELRQEELDFQETERISFESECSIRAELNKLKIKVDSAAIILDEVKQQCGLTQEANENAKQKLGELVNLKMEISEKVAKFQEEALNIISNACLSVSRNRKREMELVIEVTNRIFDADERIVKQAEELLISLQKNNKHLNNKISLISKLR